MVVTRRINKQVVDDSDNGTLLSNIRKVLLIINDDESSKYAQPKKKKGRHKKIHTVIFHLYGVQEQAEVISL